MLTAKRQGTRGRSESNPETKTRLTETSLVPPSGPILPSVFAVGVTWKVVKNRLSEELLLNGSFGLGSLCAMARCV